MNTITQPLMNNAYLQLILAITYLHRANFLSINLIYTHVQSVNYLISFHSISIKKKQFSIIFKTGLWYNF